MTHPSGQRAADLWRGLFRTFMAGQEAPVGSSTALEVAEIQDIGDLLLSAALTLDQIVTTGALEPGRAEQVMLQLLVVRDYVLPLPPDAGPRLKQDFETVVAAARDGRRSVCGRNGGSV